jgi:hypothetical protein
LASNIAIINHMMLLFFLIPLCIYHSYLFSLSFSLVSSLLTRPSLHRVIHRGGRNALMLLSGEDRKKGVITASAGNHALALAWHGKDLGIPVVCVMPSAAPLTKVQKCRKYGATVILHGEHIGQVIHATSFLFETL